MEMHNRFKIRLLITAVFSIAFVLGCVSKKNIKIPLSDPLPHPKLAQMQSLSIEEKDGVIYFGKSKKYQKRGITVVLLKGDPYEIGYAHGVFLKDEIKRYIRESLYWTKTQFFGTSFLENMVFDRAREIEQYVPEKYITELKGLAAGSGIDYEAILALNTYGTTVWSFISCTSVAVIGQEGKIIRSRGYETPVVNGPPVHAQPILFIHQPSQGYAFTSVMIPGDISVVTAKNQTGLNIGSHAIVGASYRWKGIPHTILQRIIIENAHSVEEVGKILEKAPRPGALMLMVTDTKKARIYEYDSEDIGYKDMDEDGLVLTNFTRVLSIGRNDSGMRYRTASSFLKNNQDNGDLSKLVGLLRNDEISCIGNPNNTESRHSAIFVPETLDFWIAVDPPPANRGRWVGFNLKKELDGSGHEPNPLIIPAGSGITIANRLDKIKINEKEPWTGKFKLESKGICSGIWAMKQEAKIVKSISGSEFEFKGKLHGNQLKGKVKGASNTYYNFYLKMSSDSMSFTGTLDLMAHSNRCQLKGKRIE